MNVYGLALTCVIFGAFGCHSGTTFSRLPDLPSSHCLDNTADAPFATVLTKIANAGIDLAVIDSVRGRNFPSLPPYPRIDEELIQHGGTDSVYDFQRSTRIWRDGRLFPWLHRLLLTKRGQVFVPEESVFIGYGPMPSAFVVEFTNVEMVDSVLRLSGIASDYLVAYEATLTISLKPGSGLHCGS